MDERIKIMNKEGIEIGFFDYSGLQEDDYLKMIEEVRKLVLSKPPTMIFAQVANVTNTPVTEKIKLETKKLLDDISNHFKPPKKAPIAVIGITGVKKVLINLIARNTHAVENEDEGIAYIIKTMKS